MTSREFLMGGALGLGLLCTGASTCKEPTVSSSDAAAPPQEAAPPKDLDVRLPGVDTSTLTPRERREFSAYVTEFLAPCPDVPVSVAQCVTEKRTCAGCAQAAKYFLKAVRAGRPRDAVEKGYKSRFDPKAVVAIPVDDSPTVGPENAPVTLVEFADFECPACKAVKPHLDRILEERAGKVRLIYKTVALSIHKRAEPAAKAALAAHQQGKFWEMAKLLFESDALEDRDLERFARLSGLDVARFSRDVASSQVKDKFERDKKLSDDVKLSHTPTIFLNGREVEPLDELSEWIAAELGELDGGGAPSMASDAGLVDAGKDGAADAKVETKTDAGKDAVKRDVTGKK